MAEKLASYKQFGVPVFLGVIVVIVLVLGGFLWGLCVVTIDQGKVGIVFHERGKSDPAGHFIVEKGYKGTQREVLPPGLHFFLTTTAFMKITQVPMTVIPEGKVGVLNAQDGRPLPEGAVLAEDDEFDENENFIRMGQKGIRKEILKQGTHLINPKYFKVELQDAFTVPSGQVGVLRRNIGDPPPNGEILVSMESNYRGIVKDVLEPGLRYLHPKIYNLELYDALNIEFGKIGVLKREIGDPTPPGQILVSLEDNYRGFIKEVMEPGLRYLHPKIYSWEVVDALNIPAGKVGVLTRKIGDPAPYGQRLVSRESNYRGIIQEVLEPGLRYLHPKIYSWEIFDAVSIPAGKVGVRTRKIGETPPSGTILVERASAYQGIIREVLDPGLYYLNPYEFAVEIHDVISIPDGFVGVKIARTGKPSSVDQLLVEEGFQGVRKDFLKPGLFYINPYEFDIVAVDTRKQKYEMTSVANQGDTAFSDEITFLSNDGFQISIDVTMLYEIQPENAPHVVATLGKDLDDVKTKIIRPGSRSFARLEGSMLKAIDFVSGETRKTFQDKLANSLQLEGARAKINIVNTFVRNYTIPENLLEPIRLKEIAEKQREQYVEEQKREEEQAKLARQKALVQQQSQKINAETGKIVAETKAEEQKRVAIIKGEQMLEVAKLEKEAAQQEKLKQIALGEGEAKRRKLLIEADNLEELRLNIYKEVMTRFASEIGKQKWVPDMIIGGGSGGNLSNSISDILNMLSLMVANQLRLQTRQSQQPETPAAGEDNK